VEEPESLKLMALSVNKNLIDKDEYPHTAELERRCVHMLADLWHAPDAANSSAARHRSSEACMLGGMAAKWRWRQKREAEGKPTDRPNMVCGPVQVVWHKFAKYWDIEMREVPMSEALLHDGRGHARARRREHHPGRADLRGDLHGRLRAGARAVAGARPAGRGHGHRRGDPCRRREWCLPRPLLRPAHRVDFRVPRVKSISTSGHKFGLAPLGVGWVIWRDAEYLPDDLIFHVTYLGGDMPVFQINFSRPAGQIVAQYYNFVRLGFDGYRAVHEASYETAMYLAGEIVKLGPFELLCTGDPRTGIPAVAWRIRKGEEPGYTLYDIGDRLRCTGWQFRPTPSPARCRTSRSSGCWCARG